MLANEWCLFFFIFYFAIIVAVVVVIVVIVIVIVIVVIVVVVVVVSVGSTFFSQGAGRVRCFNSNSRQICTSLFVHALKIQHLLWRLLLVYGLTPTVANLFEGACCSKIVMCQVKDC